MMKILYVTSEAAPFAASGGLGDVMGAFPIAVSEKEGFDVSVIMPLYRNIKPEHKADMEHYADISFKLSWRNTGASIYKTKVGNATYYFVENNYYFNRCSLYGEYDDAERFAFFSRAVVEFMLSTHNIPDILHSNDWQTATVNILLKTEYKVNSLLSNIKTVYTIHNIEYQGKYDPYILGDVFGIDERFLPYVEYNGAINLMKGALVLSDYVTTVSENYKEELSYEYFAFGLSDIIKSVSHKMSGVINGIDYTYFSPDEDNDIYQPYKLTSLVSGKSCNKRALCREIGLEYKKDIPLIAMITRLTEGKGIDLVLHVIEELLSKDIQLVILGTGDKKYEQALSLIESKHNNFKALIKFDRVLSKKIYASADIFLMPSKSEPCGLAQMIACSYGTPPIVRSVGGLKDTIIPYGEEGANGFRFDNFNAHEMLSTILHATNVFKDKDAFRALMKSAKKSVFSWDKSAEKYISIYNKLI